MDRRFFSRFSSGGLTLQIHKEGVLADADGQEVTWEMVPLNQDGQPATSGVATRDAVGVYSANLSSVDLKTEGLFDLYWNYALDAVPQTYVTEIEVGPVSPDYEALPAEWRQIVDQVWLRLSDLFDSTFGGPHLRVYRANNFGRNRVAQLFPMALQRLNTHTSGHVHRRLGEKFPFSEWGGVLEQSLYIQVLKHFVRSFVEQPEAILGTTVSRMDRRDYMNRWQQVLDSEEREFSRSLDRYRMAHFGLGQSALLVSGGAFGSHGPNVAGTGGGAAARGYYPVRRFH